MNRPSFLFILTLIPVFGVLLVARPSTALDAKFTITDLGTLGGDRSSAFGINDAGQIVGTSTTTDGATRAFVYDHGSLAALGTFGGRDSMAYAISDVGIIAGRAQDPFGAFRAFVVSGSGTLTDLTAQDPTVQAPFSTATGVNARGEVVGYRQSASEHMAARTRGFLYSDATLLDLGAFGGEDAVLTAVNDLGRFVGFYSNESHADYASHRAFWMQQGGIVQDLGTLGGQLTTPTAISNSGRIVGFGQLSNGENRAFAYEANRLLSLGTLPGGRQSFAYGLNESGSVVGSSAGQSGSLRAALFTGNAVVDLNDLLPSGSGWLLTEARDINASGAIVGNGVIQGRQHAFLLTPGLSR